MDKSRTYQLKEWFPQEWESAPTELARFIRERAKPIEAGTETHSQLSYACSVHNSFEALSEAPTTRGAADVSQQERKQDLKTKSVQHRREHTNICIAIEPEGAKAVKQDEEWEEIKLAADSGATDTVIPPGDLHSIELREGAPSKRGVECEKANGSFCPNLGEKQFVGVTAEGEAQSVVAQVVDVSQGLLSVKKCTKSGDRVVFDSEGSYGWLGIIGLDSGRRLTQSLMSL